ncbi:hypothetical protein SD427_15565 [Chryseobacterium sp. JJR-5R]|uniref:LIC_10190 family membrane protein n=1 Tax=Chryseobacterium sp. JJR-5R TaxID=3093923 RepID=UPI002A748CE3|nr:hypothetical protein [Chryseobacterium sp. JJR-5R]WPO82173.1 hypothetical protein SD427_15565 [Chryseobacterium sp. JJR-5R]
MVVILLSTIFILPILMGWGDLFQKFTGSFIQGISGKALLGILGISLFWTILAFFIPLNIYAEIPVILAGLFFFFRNSVFRQLHLFKAGDYQLLLFIALIISFCGSFYPYVLDHFGYYVPTIKWLTEFGLVRGISNVDLTLGQMSVWHIFQSGFSNFSDPFLRMNSVLLIVYALYITENKSWIHLCFIPVLLLFSQSPSPDLPVIVFSLILLNEILTQNKNTAVLFAFSVFVFTIKPTMIWLPVLGLLYAVFIIRSDLKTLIPGILIGLLFFIKNIYTFGYPVFPVALGDLGISWQPAHEVLQMSSQYAIQKTYDMQYSYQEIQSFPFWDYIRNWLFLEGIKSKINIFFIISLGAFTVYSLKKKRRIYTFILVSILIKSILVLMFSAQYRFFLDVFFVIFFIVFIDCFNRKKSVAVCAVLSSVFIAFLTAPTILQTYVPSFNLGNFMGKFEKEQLYRPSTYHYNSFQSYRIGNFKFNVSKKYPYSFDTPLPAVSESYLSDHIKAGIFPQMTDKKDLSKGFIWKKLNAKEKKEAERVIRSVKNAYQ